MSADSTIEEAREAVEAVYRAESRRVFATLVRLLGDFDVAEEAMHEAFASAVEQWPREGVPANPRAWLVSAGRFKAIDAMRRRARFDASLGALAERLGTETPDAVAALDDERIEDDRLRLIFTCCHPALPAEARVALTLREVCGLTTEEIARAFLTAPPTVAQRIVRAKAKIKSAGIPYRCRRGPICPSGWRRCCRSIYLVFNEGYSASSGAELTRADLSGEAIRLGRLLAGVAAGAGSDWAGGADAAARVAAGGSHVARLASWCCWRTRTGRFGTTSRLRRGWRWCGGRWPCRALGPYVDAGGDCGGACRGEDGGGDGLGSNRGAITACCAQIEPSPVIELNRAVAIAMRDGPAAGLELIDALLAARRIGRLPPRPFGAGRSVPPAGAHG